MNFLRKLLMHQYQITPAYNTQQEDMYKSKPLMVKIGMCSLNNGALDFKNNCERIIKSIQQCIDLKCKIRVGTELEIPGYACNDHFNEYDTINHSWEVIEQILKTGLTKEIVVETGMPILHHGNIYNCRILLFENKVVGIRPKIILADGDCYFETRWFGFWKERGQISEFKLPRIIQEVTGQKRVPIGEFLVEFNDTSFGWEICQQAWISDQPLIESVLDGVQIVLNPSASYIERGKLERKIQMIKQFTQRNGGAYIYTNVKGAVGDRTYFDGGSIFTENGRIKGLSPINTIDDMLVTPIICDLTSIRTFRLSNKSFLKSTNGVSKIARVNIDIYLATCDELFNSNNPEQLQNIKSLQKQYEFPHARWEPSLFLWDYLRKSHGGAYFLALSGGLDSCSVAIIIQNMCELVCREVNQRKNSKVLKDLRKIVDDTNFEPKSPREICGKIFYTCYMGTDNSSVETQERAKKIAQKIGSNHRSINFQHIFQSYSKLSNQVLGVKLDFKKHGGSWRTDLALQNIQARSRMLLSYMLSQTQFEVTKRKGFMLVLGSSNVDESLRGYFTKYDCSSADVNPIGSFSKIRLREFLRWNLQKNPDYTFISDILNAPPTAELQPLLEGEIAQNDEEDMGLTYQQLHLFGQMRRLDKLGPVSMFHTIYTAHYGYKAKDLAEKIKHFYKSYANNRHKMTTITPGFHYEPVGCDDNRLDMRPLLYETDWAHQFEQIDMAVEKILEKQSP